MAGTAINQLDSGRLTALVHLYRARTGVLTDGSAPEVEVSGPGGGLAEAVEQHGLVPLASKLHEGQVLVLTDEGVSLELRRVRGEAVMRVSWDGGPSYEERVAMGDGGAAEGSMEPAPAPAPAPVSAAASAVVQTSEHPLFTPDENTRVSDLAAALHDVSTTLYVTEKGVFRGGQFGVGQTLKGVISAQSAESLGDPTFRTSHGVRANYVAGAMAGGIGSAEIVIAMAKAGLIGFFGAGGLPIQAVRDNVARIKKEIPTQPCGCNLLHNPAEPAVEEETVDIYLKANIRKVSASAYMRLTRAIVRYRLTGIHKDAKGRIVCPNQVFAKVSRPEVAEQFIRPAPERLVKMLVDDRLLTPEQAEMAKMVPMAEDITAEADSGGHTDRRPLVVLLPTLLRFRDQICAEEGYAERGIRVRVGAAGGLGDPASVYGAFALGADYVLTGSVNQSTVEAGTSRIAKEMVSTAGFADCTTGPAPDMFELGAHVQVLGRGSMYAQRAGRLYNLWKTYPSIEAIPEKDRLKIEKTILQRTLAEVWADTEAYWAARDTREVEKAQRDPRHKMALCFRWYLGMTSRWARTGEPSRKRDYQIWCGPSMGLFNDWVRGSWLEDLDDRKVVDLAWALLVGAAGLRRVEQARALGIDVPAGAMTPTPHR